MIDDEVLSGDAQLDAHVKHRTAETAAVDVLDVYSAVQYAAEKMLELLRFALYQVIQRGLRRDIPIGNLRLHDHRVSLVRYCTTHRRKGSGQPRYLDDGRRLASCEA